MLIFQKNYLNEARLNCLGDKCGGAFRYTESGIKDCSACLRPHRRENYNAICGKMSEVLELVRRK